MSRRESKFKHLSPENQQVIHDFIAEGRINGLSPATLHSKKTMLTIFAHRVNKNLKDITKEDVQRFFNNTTLSVRSQELMKIQLKNFTRWLYNLEKDDRLPESVRWLKCLNSRQLEKATQHEKPKRKIISVEEYQKMINSTGDIQLKAILEILWLIGPRVGELRSMNIKDVKEYDDHIDIRLPKSKTQPRTVPITQKLEHLMTWLRNHPFTGHPDKPLWINQWRDNRVHNKRISISAIEYKIKNNAKDAGINRRITPHMFRHTAITRDRDNGMPETHICTKYGWVKGSTMLQEYDHNDYDDLRKWLKAHEPNNKPPSYETLKRQKEHLEKKNTEELDVLRNEITKMKQKISLMNKALSSDFGKFLLSINDDDRIYIETRTGPREEELEGKLIVPAEQLSPQKISQRYIEFKKNVETIMKELREAGDHKELKEYNLMVDNLL
jgi:integrase